MDRTFNARTVAMAGMLSAVASLLGFFKIPITSFIELRFSSLPIAVAGYLFGPLLGGIVGAVSDIGQYLIKPTGPFFPGFTISSCVTGMIFGWAFHFHPRLFRAKPGTGESSPAAGFPGKEAGAAGSPWGRLAAALSSLTGRLLCAEILVALLVGICLNSLWLSMLYQRNFGTVLSVARAVKEIAMIPVNTLLLRAVIQPFSLLSFMQGGEVLYHKRMKQ